MRRALGDLRADVARDVLRELEAERQAVRGLDGLARLAESAHRRYRELVRESARGSALAEARVAVDDLLETDEVEYLDRDDVPDATRREIIESLSTFNRLVLAYRRFTRLLAPLVEAARERRAGQPVRILELGSGHGELAFRLADWAAERGVPVEVTASDLAQVYVDLGNRKAADRGSPVRYLRLDALEIALRDRSQDVVLMTQTLHHFGPGQLARLFAESARVGDSALFVDGWRSLAVLAGVTLTFAALFPRSALHDAFISTRKFYSDAELLLFASLTPAAPRARISFAAPGYTVLRFLPTERVGPAR